MISWLDRLYVSKCNALIRDLLLNERIRESIDADEQHEIHDEKWFLRISRVSHGKRSFVARIHKLEQHVFRLERRLTNRPHIAWRNIQAENCLFLKTLRGSTLSSCCCNNDEKRSMSYCRYTAMEFVHFAAKRT